VVESFASRIPVRLVVASERPGSSFARNAGAEAALGDYLLFVDDDDRVTPGWLDAMAQAAEHADIIGGKERWIHSGPDGIGPTTVSERDGLDSAFGFLPIVSGSNSGIRRDLFHEVGGFNERYKRAQDIEFFWRAQIVSGHPPEFVPDAVLEYRLRSGMRAVWKQAYEDGKDVPRLYRDFRSHGMPRNLRSDLRGWLRIARYGPRWLLSYRGREELAKEAGWRIGRMVGSAHHRVLYF
jgi:glycosyltransferase involved in cell wall biosynthesis